MHELPQIPDRRYKTESEENQGICGQLSDAGDRTLARHRLRQSVEDRALRDGPRSHAQASRTEAGICNGRRVRPRRRSGQDGPPVRGKSELRKPKVSNNTQINNEQEKGRIWRPVSVG